MNNSKLLSLVSIVVVFFVAIIVLLSLSINKASEVREQAFRKEATNVVESANKAIKKYNENTLTFTNNENVCKKDKVFCFTVKYLIDNKLYDGNENMFSGKIEIDTSKNDSAYSVYFKKGDEFKIIGGFRSDYTKHGTLSIATWNSDYETCTCN